MRRKIVYFDIHDRARLPGRFYSKACRHCATVTARVPVRPVPPPPPLRATTISFSSYSLRKRKP